MTEHIRGQQSVDTDLQTTIYFAQKEQYCTQRGFRMHLGALSELKGCRRVTLRHVKLQ